MRRLLVTVTGIALLVAAYALWPLASAYQIRQAVHSGDVATLERMVQWTPVRESLKASLALLPAAAVAGDGDSQHLSLWGRIKAAAVPVVADHYIDKYVSAEGVSLLQTARRGAFLSILGMPQAPKPSAEPGTTSLTATLQRVLAFYGKIVHARFETLSAVEIEVADRPDAPRHWLSRFELSDFQWKLASLRVIPASP